MHDEKLPSQVFGIDQPCHRQTLHFRVVKKGDKAHQTGNHPLQFSARI